MRLPCASLRSALFHLLAIGALTLPGCAAPDESTSDSAGAITAPAASATTTAPATTAPATTTIAGLSNFRDLGGVHTADGKTVKRGRLFRSQQLDGGDKAALAALHLEEIGDFRGDPEKAGHADPDLAGAVPLAVPIFDDAHPENDLGAQLMAKLGELSAAGDDPDALEQARRDVDAWANTLNTRMIEAYTQFATDAGAEAKFATLVQTVASGKVTLFHCVSGKDRTGFAAAIILRGLGVSWKDTLADYLKSNDALAAENAAKIAGMGTVWTDAPGHLSVNTLQTIFGVDEAFLHATFASIQDQFGADHPPKDGEVASDEAIAAFYASVFGANVQSDLKKALLE